MYALARSRLACASSLVILTATVAWAQTTSTNEQERPRSLWTLSQQVVVDPTTCAPAVLSYGAARLDWDSSQVFFRNGYLEQNPAFTRTGLSHDVPVSAATGRRRTLSQSFSVLAGSAANNLTCRVLEQTMLTRYPGHRRLVNTLGWIERIAVGSYVSYRHSAAHFRQWRANQRLSRENGWQ
jgi:hypothetical protein